MVRETSNALNRNHLTFHFAAIDWSAPHKVQYSYKMEGLDDDWSVPTSEANADYRSLPSGTFTLQVQAIGAAQEWSEPLEYTFTILPPWWATTWFRILMSAGVLALALGAHRWRLGVADAREARLAETVEARTRELQVANDELKTFSHSVAHDLRAPLRAIDGFGKILSDEKSSLLDEEGLRLLGVVRDNTRLMAALIEDLLELSRIGRGDIKRVPCDMETMVRAVILDLEQEVTDPTRRVSVGPLPEASVDPVLIRQVWINLLSNAFKFSSSGEEIAVIEVQESVNGSDRVYSVKDNGVGFNMDHADKLFGVFERLHRREEFEGTGIGLSIVKRIVDRHGGRIWAEGKVGEGATFWFALPNPGE